MAMVLVELFQTGLVLLSKVVIGHGMFVFALVTYRGANCTAVHLLIIIHATFPNPFLFNFVYF